MSQIIINTGNIANDGTGDPLRTAFNDVNNNFTQVFNAGPVGSNITIANNTIQTTNTNGNLRLATNGIGAIVPAANFVPDVPNARYIGTATNRFNTIYSQYLNATTGAFSSNVYITGNLNVVGNTITNNYSNANIANLTLTLAGGSSNAVMANGAGILVHSANANFVYNYSSNSWNSTLAITAPTFIGDGSQLTDVNANVNANDLLGNTLSSSVVFSNLTSFGSITEISATGDISTTGNVYANVINGNVINGTFVGDGSSLTNITANAIVGNVPFALNANSAYTANLAALATQAINADTALFAINANLAAFANVATSAQTANTARYSVQSDNANSAVVAGMAYELSPAANLSITGNITTSGYFLGNGSQLTGIVATADYGNANVAAYLPTYGGDVLANDVTANALYMGDVPPSTPGQYYFYANSTSVALGETAAQGITVNSSGIDIGGTAGVNIYGVNGSNVNIGNPTGGYIVITNDVISANSITATTYFGDGSNLTGVGGNYGNANVADYLPTYSGNLVNLGGDVNTSGNVSASGNITAGGGAYFIGDGSLLTNLPAGNYSNANVASYLPTYTGNITANTISVTGNINGRLSNGNSSINIANNGNITLGIGPFNFTRLNVSSFGISVAGNIVGSYLYGDGSNITNLPAGNYGNSNVAAYLPTYTGNLAGFDVSVTGNVYTDGKVLHLGETTANGVAANGAGIVVGNDVAEIVYDNSVFGWSVNQGWHPTANVSYNLGRTNRQWNNFYALNINGTDVAVANSVGFSDGSWQSTAFVGIAETAKALANVSNIPVTIGDGITTTAQWIFNADGTLTLSNIGGSAGSISATDVDVTINVSNTANAGGVTYTFGQDGNLNVPLTVSATDVNVSSNVTANIFNLIDAGNLTYSSLRKNQNPPYGSEAYGIELITTTDDPNVFSSISSGPDYVALLSTNAGNANVVLQGGYGITLSTSNATGGSIKEWSFVSSGDALFPGNLSVVGNITGNYIYGNGYYLTGISGGGGGNATSLNNGSAAFTLETDGSLLTTSTGNVPANFVVNGASPDIDLRNNSGTGTFTQGSTNYTVRVAGIPNWIFDNTGTLALPAQISTPGVGEATALVGTRTIVGGLNLDVPYSAELAPGGTPTLAYISTPGTQSVKITFAVQSNGSGLGYQWEQFDVVATFSSSGGINFVVSNRVKANLAIPDTVVTAGVAGSQIEIYLTLDVGQTTGGTSSFNAVEFGLMVD